MCLINFKYDNVTLSDLGYMVCTFGTGGLETVSIGSNISFNTVKNNNSSILKKISTQYDEVYSVTFQITKSECEINSNGEILESEVRKLMKWLNRKDYLKFQPIYDDQASDTYYMGSFNVQAITFSSRIIGLELTFTANAPYGFGETVVKSSTVSAGGSISLNSDSDEIGYLSTNVVIKCTSAGNLTIKNKQLNETTIINNCVKNETITLDGENKIILSSVSHSKLYNDFNYIFPRIITSYASDKNEYVFSLPCTVNITYSPIRKVGVV